MKHFQAPFSDAPLAAAEPIPDTEAELLLDMMTHEERMRGLVRRYFSNGDLLAVRKRLIGSGSIGGKACGMLLARAILKSDTNSALGTLLEPHDSFFIGSHLFASFITHNGWLHLLQEQQSGGGYITAAAKLRDLIPVGDFPSETRTGFKKMLEHYGQYPIIARSSSLMEDGFGNAFAGKYDSFFCVNQGTLQERLKGLEKAVKKIYLSMMSDEALQYRLRRGLAGGREEMAILVQRVSGRRHDNYFLPDLAGVGVSYNTFVWNSSIDPTAGMLRLVTGLGTRAVDRPDGDYPRIVSLDQPTLLAVDQNDLRRFSQRDIDLLDIAANSVRTISIRQFFAQENSLPINLIGQRDGSGWLVTFEKLFSRTQFAEIMRKLLALLEKAYGYPVDVEFTVNFTGEDTFRLNIVQCRPLQTRGVQSVEVKIAPAAEEETYFTSRGNFMGGSVLLPLRRVVRVDPEKYSALVLKDKYELAKIIGRINRLIPSPEALPTLLVGPGRWGTTTPSLGVPVKFAEFDAMAAIAEVAFSAGGLMPELSFGSHFFQDLVESGICYVALYPDKKECFLNDRLVDELPNLLPELLPDDARFADLLRIVDLPDGFALQADIVSQRVACSLLPDKAVGEQACAAIAAAGAAGERFATTGLPGLDQILGGLRLGDNVVWRLDKVADFVPFVTAFARSAVASGRKVVYIRFAGHQPLLRREPGVKVHNLDALRGFESFTVGLHAIIAEEGREAFYVFDCLSSLLDAWATDTMVGNFFAVTCPFLYELDTIAYFPLLHDVHPFPTMSRIRHTTQLLLDVHTLGDDTIIHPLKVAQRFSPTMFLPHRLKGAAFEPVVDSSDATSLFRDIHKGHLKKKGTPHIDHWEWLFLRAAKLARSKGSEKSRQAMVETLARLLFGSDSRMLNLARRYMNLDDFLRIKERLIGTGYLGGKTAGMLIARAILEKDAGHDWHSLLEPHDSFFVGSDLFHSYIVHNGWWKIFMEHKQPEGYYEGAAKLGKLLLQGSFPPEIREQFQKMLEHFGQYPIIVRLSSLQEDGFGNAFAGKYGSYFCINQGSPEERYCQFEEAVRLAYASTMSEDALRYRLNHGLDRQEEQLALLVQRVSGAYHGRYFFPEISGVGLSYNTYVWDESVDPHAGMLRLVFGLGTRACGRVAGDYPRIASLGQPTNVPFRTKDGGNFQRQIDLLDIAENACRTMTVAELLAEGVPLPEIYTAFSTTVRRRGGVGVEKLLSFDRLLSAPEFPEVMRLLLATLEKAYGYPVDLEFTATSSSGSALRLNLLQCRPLQTRGVQVRQVEIPERHPLPQLCFKSKGSFLGGSILQPISRIIHVSTGGYLALSESDRHEVARIIGRLNRLIPSREEQPTLLIAPGRLGTTTPEMGVTVRFAEIDAMTALAEVSFSQGSLMPELSFGSHFFQDLVESGIFYAAIYPEEEGCAINPAFITGRQNILPQLLPDYARFADVLRVIEVEETVLMADIVSQKVCCLRKVEEG